jgi:hypothetical protein
MNKNTSVIMASAVAAILAWCSSSYHTTPCICRIQQSLLRLATTTRLGGNGGSGGAGGAGGEGGNGGHNDNKDSKNKVDQDANGGNINGGHGGNANGGFAAVQ